MEWLNRLPSGIKVAFVIGGGLMSAFSGKLPDSIQEFGLWLGIAIVGVGLVALTGHFVRTDLFGLLSKWKFQWPLVRKVDPPVPLHMALYVGHFWADFTQLKEHLHFTITLVLFNQTDRNIVIESVRGNVVFERFMNMAAVSLANNLPLTVLAHQHDGVAITIRQNVSNDEKDRICEILASGGNIPFNLSLITFLIHESGRAAESIRLHNVDGITCRYPKEGDIICGKAVFVGATLAARGDLRT
jgi:hypothetical protein